MCIRDSHSCVIARRQRAQYGQQRLFFRGGNTAACAQPVSYTHLDVYKRQDQDQLHGLKTVLDEMSDRLESYTSFAGAPEDAESSVKFVYKTAETVAAADNVVAETETVKEGNIFTRLWQRIVDLFKF